MSTREEMFDDGRYDAMGSRIEMQGSRAEDEDDTCYDCGAWIGMGHDCPEIERALQCAVCGAYLTNGTGFCDTDTMTTAAIARLVWELEQQDAVNSGLDYGRTSQDDQDNIDQLNRHLAARMEALATR